MLRREFRRQDRRQVGGERGRLMTSKVVEPTAERLAVVRSAELAYKLRHRGPWENLPLETLEAVAALVWPSPSPATQDGEG